jgi:hypothetical protein
MVRPVSVLIQYSVVARSQWLRYKQSSDVAGYANDPDASPGSARE